MPEEKMQPEYARPAAGEHVTAAMDLLQLSSTGLQAMLGNRTSDSLIRLWRTNRRAPPQWAMDVLAAEIEQRIRPQADLARALRLSAGPGRGSNVLALAAWRQRRAAQKEKARE